MSNIYKGDDLSNIIEINIENPKNIDIKTISVQIGPLNKTIHDPTNPCYISLTNEESSQLNTNNPVYVAVLDSEGNKTTAEGFAVLNVNEEIVKVDLENAFSQQGMSIVGISDENLVIKATLRIGVTQEITSSDGSVEVLPTSNGYDLRVLGGGGGGGGGTDIHNQLLGRDVEDCHPINSITGLEVALNGKVEASDIPTALPNPNAITINGTSYDGSTAVDITIESGGGAESTYTNEEPSVIEVGGIKKGTTFENETMQNMFDMLLYPELFPSFTSPSSTFSENVANLVEVGSTNNIRFTTSFNRGTITPAYTTSGFRSGAAIEYIYTGTGLSTVSSSQNTNVQDVVFNPTTAGVTSWTSRVRYAAGEQPLSSKGNDYDSPLPAGLTAIDTLSITAVYAYYATTASIGTMTKQALSSSNSYYEVNMVGESDTEKQTVDLFDKTVNRITVYNSLTREWDEQDLASFVQSSTTHGGLNYNRYTHTGGKIGARQIRFYF